MPNLAKAEWEMLCPDLTIGTMDAPAIFEFENEALSQISDHFWEEGYLKLDQVFPLSEIDILSKALDILDGANIPPVYIYVYDQPWLVFERLRALIAHFLGTDYALLPNLWAWHLSKPGDAGWPPHKDCDSQTVFPIGPDKLLLSLSLWIPLTDVTEESGCMYVIPRRNEGKISEAMELERDRLKALAIPLPAKAGSVMGWPQDLIHWGGEFSTAANQPRKSLSFEFQNTSFEPLVTPLLDTGNPPLFDQRIQLIGQQFEKYRHIANS